MQDHLLLNDFIKEFKAILTAHNFEDVLAKANPNI